MSGLSSGPLSAAALDGDTKALPQIVEAAAASDTFNATANYHVALSAAASATETIWATQVRTDAVIVESLINSSDRLRTDSIVLETLHNNTASGSLIEAGTASDTFPATAAMHVAHSEAGSAGDAIDGHFLIARSITEAGSAGDAVDAILTHHAALTETGSASDTIDYPAGASLSGSLTEPGNPIDHIAAVVLHGIGNLDSVATETALADTGIAHVDSLAIETFQTEPCIATTDGVSVETQLADTCTITGDDVLVETLVADTGIMHADVVLTEGLVPGTQGITQGIVKEVLFATPIAQGIFFWGYQHWYNIGLSPLACWVAGLDCGDHPVRPDGSVFVPYGADPDGLFTRDYLIQVSNNPPEDGFGPSACNIDLTDINGFTTRVVVDAAIGMPYRSRVQLLRPNPRENQPRFDSALAQTRRLHQYGAQLTLSQGLSVGTTDDNLRPVVFRQPNGDKYPMSQTFTGVHWDLLDHDYDYNGMLIMEMFRPYPVKIDALAVFFKTFHRTGAKE